MTRENRYHILGHVITCFEKLFIYHRKSVSDKLRVFVSDIKIEFVRACFLGFSHDCMRNNISWRKLQTVVIILHKSFAVAVFKISSLASDRFRYKESFTSVLVVKACWVELDIAEVFYLCSKLMSNSYAVACCDSGVCSVFVNSAYSTSCKNGVSAIICRIFVVISQHKNGKTCFGFLCVAHNGIFEYFNII